MVGRVLAKDEVGVRFSLAALENGPSGPFVICFKLGTKVLVLGIKDKGHICDIMFDLKNIPYLLDFSFGRTFWTLRKRP